MSIKSVKLAVLVSLRENTSSVACAAAYRQAVMWTNSMRICHQRMSNFRLLRSLVLCTLLGAQCPATAKGLAGAQQPDRDQRLRLLADSVVAWVARKDWMAISAKVHPDHGLRFSPCAYVDTSHDVVLPREQIAGIGSNAKVFRWGFYDGSGEPIDLTFDDYYERFIYNRDFRGAQVGPVNRRVHNSNTINNIEEAYAGREVSFIEYHMPGSGELYDFNWASIRLVFERSDGEWFLVGIVHDQWTI